MEPRPLDPGRCNDDASNHSATLLMPMNRLLLFIEAKNSLLGTLFVIFALQNVGGGFSPLGYALDCEVNAPKKGFAPKKDSN